jgi:hypothetical protein
VNGPFNILIVSEPFPLKVGPGYFTYLAKFQPVWLRANRQGASRQVRPTRPLLTRRLSCRVNVLAFLDRLIAAGAIPFFGQWNRGQRPAGAASVFLYAYVIYCAIDSLLQNCLYWLTYLMPCKSL